MSTVTPGSTLMTRVFMSVQTSIMASLETALVSSTRIEPSSTSAITPSPTGSLSASQYNQAPPLSTTATLFGSTPRSGRNLRIPILAIVLLCIFAVILLTATIYLLRLRTRHAYTKHHQIDFERRMEVIEARAIMPIDKTLKRPYFQTPLFGGEDKASEGKELAILTRVYSNDDLNAHPLFHAELKKSRTLSFDRRYPRTPFTPSTQNLMSSRTALIELPISPVSPRSPFVSGALSQYTTMQTRRPKTPPMHIVLPELQNELATFYQNPVFKSMWSSPTASEAPPSSSLYSDIPTKSGLVSLSPMPARTNYTPSPPIQSAESNREGSVQPLNLPTSSTRPQRPHLFTIHTGTAFNATPLDPSKTRSSSPVHSSFNAPTEPERIFYPPSRRPSLAELNAMSDDTSVNCPLGLERVKSEVKIARWLEDSTVTLTSLVYEITPEDQMNKGRRLSSVDRGRQGRRRSVKLSPIRDMRPSWAKVRRGSAQPGEDDVSIAVA